MTSEELAMQSSGPQFFQVAALDDVIVTSAGKGRLVAGDRLMALFAYFDPGVMTPIHTHPHEQLTYVLEGMVHLQIEEEGRDLGPGEGASIPGGIPHGVVRVGPNGAKIIEIFTPPRENYLALLRKGSSSA